MDITPVRMCMWLSCRGDWCDLRMQVLASRRCCWLRRGVTAPAHCEISVSRVAEHAVCIARVGAGRVATLLLVHNFLLCKFCGGFVCVSLMWRTDRYESYYKHTLGN